MPEREGRTEQATPRRRQKAREEGRAARSRDLTSTAAMTGVLAVIWFAGSASLNRISGLMTELFRFRRLYDPIETVRLTFVETMRILAPFLIAGAALSVAAAVVQSGFVARPLRLQLDRVNPISGIRRLFSATGFGDAFRSLVKFGAGGAVLYLTIKQILPMLPGLAALQFRYALSAAGGLIAKAVLPVLTVYIVLAAIDYLYERWMFERSIRMTKEEVREELRETEGDPLVKSRIRSIQRELARRRMMEEVPKAAVVVTNPTHIAVALAYERTNMAAPKVVAKGKGYIAEKIREIARRHNVPIVEDKPLARALHRIEIGRFIPEELYRAVAKILAYIYKMKERTA